MTSIRLKFVEWAANKGQEVYCRGVSNAAREQPQDMNRMEVACVDQNPCHRIRCSRTASHPRRVTRHWCGLIRTSRTSLGSWIPEGMPTITSAAAQLQITGEGTNAGLPAAASAQQQGTDFLLLDNDQSRALGCALIAMICTMLATLIGMIFLARQPALFNQLEDSGRGIIQRAPAAKNLAFRPSLLVLSISRT